MKKLLLPLFLLTLTFNAHAGFLIDPYIGTGSFAGTLDLANGADADDVEETVTAMGSRVGYSFLLVSAGIDYQILSVDGESQNNISAFVGVDLPILLRFWGEYFISSDADVEGDVETSLDFKDGYGLGVGFTGLPLVSLNLEVQYLNYEGEASNIKFDYDTVAYIASVSLPLDF
tara:strand:- start:80969 stop:81490 length:522 start_codon:yes stop_codon:yes gene_type:complete